MGMKNIEFLQELWAFAPLSWAIIRAQECALLADRKYTSPILEVGCGDGLVSEIALKNKKVKIDLGIDLDTDEIRRAKKTGIYKEVKLIDITQGKIKENYYNTVFANGVLEHIPNLDNALASIRRSLKKGGFFYTTSPSANFSYLLFFYRLFSKIGLPRLAHNYEKFLNSLFFHKHLLTPSQWEKLLYKNGFEVEKIVFYNNQSIVWIHELSLAFALATKFIKRFTDRMVLFVALRRQLVALCVSIFTPVLSQNCSEYKQNGSLFIIARKK